MKLLKSCKIILMVIIFSLITASCTMSDAGINVHIWEDSNRNGEQDSGEVNLPEVQIEIIGSGNHLLRTNTSTDEGGDVYELAAGGKCTDYMIVAVVSNNFWPTTPIFFEDGCDPIHIGLIPYP